MRKTIQAIGMSLAFMAVIVLALGLPSAMGMTAAEIDGEATYAIKQNNKHVNFIIIERLVGCS